MQGGFLYKVLLGVPSSGTLSEQSAQASWLPSLKHAVTRFPSCNSGPNFNACWAVALNGGMSGQFTHFAMVHADVGVVEDEEGLRWLDRLLEEMDSVKADFLSCPVAIKDVRGLTSCGIGDPENRWNPWKRFTVPELADFPKTFCAADVGYADKFLNHNHGLCVWDLRNPKWYEPDENNSNKFIFNFTEDLELVNGVWKRKQDSEDWAYSRQLWKEGMRTFITTRVKVTHQGGMDYGNWGEGGTFLNGDEDTAANWRKGPRMIELALREIEAENEMPFFVQVGAHDGKTLDPVYSWTSKSNWRGLLIEPQPDVMEKLRTNYSDNPRVAFERCVVAPWDGVASFWRFRPGQGLPYHSTMLASLSRDWVERNTHGYEGAVEELSVPARTPEHLAKVHGFVDVNLLQVDAEGADSFVVRGFLAAGVRPDVIHFEDPDANKELEADLVGHGYKVYHDGADTLAVKA